MKKYLYICVVVILLFSSVTLGGCIFNDKAYTSGIFRYAKLAYPSCTLVGIDGGNNKLEAIEIPFTCDGLIIESIIPGQVKTKKIEHKYVKKLYINYNVKSIQSSLSYDLFYCENLEKIVINNINVPDMFFHFSAVADSCSVILSKESFEKELDSRIKDERGQGWIEWFRFKLANIEYYFNYENADNGGYYRIDYVKDAEDQLYQFAEPTREGYTFGGWYLEPACQTQWDNSIHKIFEEPITTQIYQDTNYKEVEMVTNKLQLYAKWIEN